jgi:CRP-like cAMP-binding protein
VEKILDALTQLHPLEEHERSVIGLKFCKEAIRKNAFILREGQIENYLYFIEEGVLRAWIGKNETEKTFEFSFENTLYSAYVSFLTRLPSEFNVQSITDMVIWRINYDDLQEIYKTIHASQVIGRLAAENLYAEKCKRELALLMQSAEERYTALFTEQPRLIMEIPLQYIASYIGITPQALSRIRKRIS